MEKDYKSTLLMMNTAFGMKANLPNKEPEILNKWEEEHLYEQRLAKNKDNQPFILHDGPPYANNSIHVGHAMNKILKDFILRYKSMKGFYCPYIPGWDTHGLPIETALTTKEKVNRKAMDVADFRDLCYKYALKQVDIQKGQFRRLGVLADWEHPYLTLDKEFEAEQIRVFAKMAEKGLIFKGLKPVYWSPSSESAFAKAEIEYKDVKATTIYLAFKVVDGKGVLDKGDEIVIWTTTPWTIPANLAVSANPDFDYSLIELDGRRLLVAKELVENFVKLMGDVPYKELKIIKGRKLEYIMYSHPLFGDNKLCPVILGHHVTLDAGTGLVHTAPGHGEDDFNVGKVYHLDNFCPVDGRGYMTSEAGEFAGMFYNDANDAIIKKLEETGILLHKQDIVHSYPHDWRTKKPIIFRTTPQWFASIEALKDDMMKAIKEVKWIPSWGEVRLGNMVKDRGEWCISRQRAWGVPIPVFYAEDGEPILDQEVMSHIADLFKEHGSQIWFRKEAKELLPKGYTNPHSPNGIFVKEKDIMDVWFDSGSSHHGVMVARGLGYPADLYLEGADQYRGWFNSSLSTGVAMTKKAPYKMVISHGFTLDGQGNKMSKSLGNTIDPQEVCKKYGADILRLWVASCEYTADVRISDQILNQNSEAYRKIRNTFRFLLGNLSDYDDKVNRVSYDELGEVDQYMECCLNNYLENVYKAYDNFEFDEVYRQTLNYLTNTLSAFYLDFTKDILYIESRDDLARRSIQTVFFDNLNALVRVLTPLIPYTCEEIYSNMVNVDKEESVYLLNMVEVVKHDNSAELLEKYQKIMAFRDDVLKAIEEARNEKIIGKSLSAKLVIKPSKETKQLLDSVKADLKTMFIVSELVITDEDIKGLEFESGTIQVTAKEGIICKRCWQVVDHVNEDGICERCAKVVKKLEENNGNN